MSFEILGKSMGAVDGFEERDVRQKPLSEQGDWTLYWAHFYVANFDRLMARAANLRAKELIKQRHDEARVFLLIQVLRGDVP